MVVEILMATYNGEKYLAEQIDSIINQTYKNWILTIRDDGSKDNTINVIKEYAKKDSRIKLLEDNNGNLGYVKNFEKLLLNAKGKYIFLADQDDIWEFNKIEVCLIYLKDYTLVHHNANIIYKNINENIKKLYEVKRYSNSWRNFIFPNFTGCCMAFQKKILNKVLPIPQGYPGHDTWIGLLNQSKNGNCYIDNTLIKYRRHEQNTSFTSEKSKNKILKKLFFRYNYICVVFWRRFEIFKKGEGLNEKDTYDIS